MEHAVIDQTEIRVSRLGFGTASLHHLFGSAERQEILRSAADVGITHFDTAPYYGYGLAEADLGAFLDGHRSQFTVATKVGLYPRAGHSRHALGVWTRKLLGHVVPRMSLPVVSWQVARARKSLDESLRRLGSDYVDFLFLHEPDPQVISTDEFLRWIEWEVTKGRLRAWGVAGERERLVSFVRSGNALARVIQTRDSLKGCEADFLHEYGRRFQFTYGYLSSRYAGVPANSPAATMRQALQRNAVGAILISTRRAERLDELINAVR